MPSTQQPRCFQASWHQTVALEEVAWATTCGIPLVRMAIEVLFSMLLLDVVKCAKNKVSRAPTLILTRMVFSLFQAVQQVNLTLLVFGQPVCYSTNYVKFQVLCGTV